MKAVILSAGEGSRMRPLTFTRPKVMLPVAGKPIIEHLILKAKEAGVGEFLDGRIVEKLAVAEEKGNGLPAIDVGDEVVNVLSAKRLAPRKPDDRPAEVDNFVDHPFRFRRREFGPVLMPEESGAAVGTGPLTAVGHGEVDRDRAIDAAEPGPDHIAECPPLRTAHVRGSEGVRNGFAPPAGQVPVSVIELGLQGHDRNDLERPEQRIQEARPVHLSVRAPAEADQLGPQRP